MDKQYRKWLDEKKGERCVENLKKNGFDAHFVQDIDSAHSLILKMVSRFESFGFAGSDTTRKIGILEPLKASGKIIHDHWKPGLSQEEDLAVRLAQGRCDCFLCSANAISETGEIVNVDGIGNRTTAMCFGPPKVVIIAGVNKITPDLESALGRVRDIAAPKRAKSLDMKTPCAQTGKCNDCNVPQRICRTTTILHRKPSLTDTSVILINQRLGF